MKNKILSLIVLCLVLTNCEIPLDYQLKIDNRLEGKDGLSMTGPGGSGSDYTEDFFTGAVDLTLTAQAKPLSVEVLNANSGDLIETLSVTEANGGYEASFSSSVSDLNVGIGDSMPLRFKVTYDNAGEDGFEYNAVLTYDFTVKDQSPNLALNKPATASAEAWGTTADRGNDGVQNGGYPNIIHTNEGDGVPSWYEVDLGAVYNVRQVNLWNRADCCQDRLTNYHILISEDPFVSNDLAEIQAQSGVTDVHEEGTAGFPSKSTNINAMGRYVRLQLDSTIGSRSINLAEMEVF